jgi:hypothetical protein
MERVVSKLQIGILTLAAACAASAVPRYIGVISADHLLLERGRGQLDSGSNYRVEAQTLRVMSGSAQSRAVVAINGSGAVEVGSLRGDLRVANADGVRVANVGAGNSIELRLEQGRDTAILTGCVARVGRAYLMRDEVSAVLVELRGAEMASQSGKHVQVTGQVVSSKGAVHAEDFAVRAAKLKVLETGCATTTGPAGSSSRARVTPMPQASGMGLGLSGSPRTVIAGVGVSAGNSRAVNAVQSHGHKPHRPHKPPISKGR